MNGIWVTFTSELFTSFILLFTLQTPERFVGFEVLTAVVMNVAIFWNIVPCSLYVNGCFGEKYRLHLQCRKLAHHKTSV
jgi:hypothetical protein